MAQCEVCGNDADRSFEIIMNGNSHTYDSFECAIHALAPKCAHCECRIVGHGVAVGGQDFCCTHCARLAEAGAGHESTLATVFTESAAG